MSKARTLVMFAIVIATVLSLFPLPIFSPMHAFVPGPAFLRPESVHGVHHYATAAALPYMIGTAVIFLILCGIAAKRDNQELAWYLLLAVPGLAALTFARLLFGGGVSGGI